MKKPPIAGHAHVGVAFLFKKMSSLFLRKYRSSETVELSIQNLNELTVKELKDNVSSKLEIPVDQLSKSWNRFYSTLTVLSSCVL